MIFTEKHKIRIANLQTELFDFKISSYDEYLLEAEKIFSPPILNYFKGESLFHRLFYIDEFSNSKYKIIPCCESEFVKDTKSKNILLSIKNLEERVKNKETSSFITLTYDNKLRAISFYQNLKISPIGKEGFFEFDLKQSNDSFHKKIDTNDSDNFSLILDEYRKIAKKHLNGICFYVIQSMNLDPQFNGSLLLVLTRNLIIDEYFEIAAFFTFIMQARVKYEYKKEILNRTLIDEHSHSWKHTIGALKTNVEQIRNNFDNKEKFSIYVKNSLNQIDKLSKKNIFLLNLMRAGSNAENINNLESNRRLAFQRKKVSFRETITNVLKTIQYSTRELGISNTNHRLLVEQDCIPQLLNSLKKVEDFYVRVIPIGLELVIEDLLKNAIFHTNYKRPKVTLYFKNSKDVGFKELHIINNQRIADPYFDLIKNGKNSEGIAKHYKVGMRTVQRILQYPIFNYTEGGWNLDVQRINDDKDTDIFIKFPNSDIV